MLAHHDSDSIVAAPLKTIDFENVDTSPYGFAVLENGYARLNWENFYVLNSEDSGVGYYGNSGYFTGITSGEQVMYNPYFATEASISLTTGTFTFNSVQMTSAWNIREKVEIQGFDADGNLVHDKTVRITDEGPKDVELNWKNISKITFLFNDNGKQDPDLTGSGNNVVFDDVVVSKIRGTTDSADLSGHKLVADGAFGMNNHHESITTVHHVTDAAHPVLVALA